MPTVAQNLEEWDSKHEWPQDGDEWSSSWGCAESQWYGTIFPRIHSFVHAPTILELAPGYGRWTQMLKNLCDRLIVVDLSPNCINACRERFKGESHIAYHVNDGSSLEMIPDNTVDFVFCFDSFVHVEAEVIGAYLSQLSRKLTRSGVGFIHHSNLGAYADDATGALPAFINNPHWRAASMSARIFKSFCEKVDLQCISQEIIMWGEDIDIFTDCFSLFTPKASVWAQPNRVLVNKDFMTEAHYIRRAAQLYAASKLRKSAVQS